MEKLIDWEPTKVTITVLSGRNLQSKRKDNVCHATVVFGMGKELFQTEEIHSNEPQWSQDAVLNVTGAKPSDHLMFKLRDKDHTVGIITIPLSSINRRRNEQWWSLQPYKREKEAHGELLLQCWVSEWRPLPTAAGAWVDNSPASSCGGSQEDLHHSNGSKPRGGSHPLPSTYSSGRPSPTISDNEVHIGLSSNLQNDQRPTDPDSVSQVSSQEEPNRPEVSGISPSEGSVRGNEKVILRGTNLGESMNDILRVVVAGVDCTDTLEYFSSGKVVVTTHSRHCPGSGPVVIETVQGGVGTSSIHYHFVAQSPSVRLRPGLAKPGGTEPSSSSLVGKRKPSSSGPDVTELLAEIKSLKHQLKDMRDTNHDLQEQNTALKSYVDKLLGLIILHNPDLLESQGIDS